MRWLICDENLTPEVTEIHDRTRERLSGNVRERAFSNRKAKIRWNRRMYRERSLCDAHQRREPVCLGELPFKLSPSLSIFY
jgi:hypothetical protein